MVDGYVCVFEKRVVEHLLTNHRVANIDVCWMNQVLLRYEAG
jgi:hypothetical protein